MNRVGSMKATAVASRPGRYRWWHALAFGVAANLTAVVVPEDPTWLASLRPAPLRPPGWAYAPAWAFSDAVQLWGNLVLLNSKVEPPRRRAVLGLQAASWLLYAGFAPAYFGLRSPILGFACTAGIYGLNLASATEAWRVEKRVAFSLVPVLLWLSLATPVAAYEAVHNPDRFFGTPAWR